VLLKKITNLTTNLTTKIMNKNLGALIGLGLDLELFYTLSVSKWEVSLQGYNTEDLANYLISMGFIKYDYLYLDNEKNSEYHIPNLKIRVVLTEIVPSV